jgi:hypothetical protein
MRKLVQYAKAVESSVYSFAVEMRDERLAWPVS